MEDLAYEMRWQSYRKDMNIRADNCARSGPHSYRALRRRFIEREKAEEELLGTWLQTTTAAEVRTTTAAEVQTTTAAAEVQTTTGAEVRTTTAAVAEEQTATAAEVRTATAAAEVQTTTGADTEVQTTPGAEAQLAQTTTAAAEAQLVQTATAADDNDDKDDNLEQCRNLECSAMREAQSGNAIFRRGGAWSSNSRRHRRRWCYAGFAGSAGPDEEAFPRGDAERYWKCWQWLRLFSLLCAAAR